MFCYDIGIGKTHLYEVHTSLTHFTIQLDVLFPIYDHFFYLPHTIFLLPQPPLKTWKWKLFSRCAFVETKNSHFSKQVKWGALLHVFQLTVVAPCLKITWQPNWSVLKLSFHGCKIWHFNIRIKISCILSLE